MPGIRIRPPATAAERQRIADFRQRLYHSYGKDPLADHNEKPSNLPE